MKNVFYTLLVIAALSSCSQEEVVSTIERTPISFGNVFVEKSTSSRADGDAATTTPTGPVDFTYSNSYFDEFYVFGTVTGNTNNTVKIYDKNKVSGVINGAWNCDVTQYWIPRSKYEFMALAGIGSNELDYNSGLMPVSIKYNLASQTDLLYATASRDLKTHPEQEKEPVDFTFDHLLSKVQFTFINEFPEASGVQLKVSDIKITNAPTEGTYQFSEGTWTIDASAGRGELNFSSGGNNQWILPNRKGYSDKVGLLIPAKSPQTLCIYFKVYNNKTVDKPTEFDDLSVDIKLQPGHSYNLTATLNAQNVSGVLPITFQITSNDWSSDLNDDGEDDNPEVKYP